jgi:hypothetical protein
MELPGATFLYNFSLIAVTFAAVSAIVMLLRQTMGGKLSNFDIHLITAYVSGGFALTLGAVMPPLFWLGGFGPGFCWGVSSGLAAFLVAAYLASIIRRRRKASGPRIPRMVLIDWLLQGAAIVMLLVNTTFPPLQGVFLFSGALTLSLAVLMWSFVRRIATLLGDKPGADWDPRRG